MPNNKYLIRVVKAGATERMVILTFQFVGDQDGYDSPVEFPVENLNMNITFEYQPNGASYFSAHQIAANTLANFSTLNTYNLTVPFDVPSNFTLGNGVILMASASLEGAEINWQFGEGAISRSTSVNFATTFENPPVEFANLTTRFTYCPGGECASLGNN